MKTYKWGIIGTGFIAQKMADALLFLPNVKLAAVASRSMDTADMFAAKYNCKAYDNYEAIANDPEIDIAYIATPHCLHLENTLMCLSKKKHVLCEKPFAVNGSEIRKMIEAASGNNVFLMEALWTRFNPRIIKAKQVIDSGRLGKIKLIRADFGERKPVDINNRFYSKELIGGSLLDMGIYPLFIAQLFMGKPTSIHAAAGFASTGVDTNCSFTLGYNDDSLSVICSTMLAETDNKVTIYCEKGTIYFSKFVYAPQQIMVVPLDGEPEDITVELIGNIYNYEAAEVVSCIEQGLNQSVMWSWQDSLLLIDTLDEIRRQIGLAFEGHDG